MLISLNWLKDLVKLDKNLDPKTLGNELTLKTAEVEKVISEAEDFENMVVGHVVEIHPHPDADKLRVAKVSVGKENLQIVCGGANLKEGMYVAVTKIGAQVRWHGEGEPIVLKKTKIRGVESEGMIAAGNEIGIEDPEAGPQDIMDLSALKPAPGTPLSELFGKDDTILEFDNKSLTHRPDLWGHQGIAREVAAVTEAEFTPIEPQVEIPTSGESVKVEIKDFELCPRYCGLIINNVKVEQSPQWLSKRLRAIGHGVHNNIVDITNYVMAELGQPLHAFDKSYIKGGIVVRRAEEKEKITTLDDKERTLTKHNLVIADHEKPVAIAGVMGGENSGINENTTSIILESANFNASSIRKTSTTLGLRTDAVQRFEKSLDPHLAELAIKRAAELILEICPGAEIAGPITDIKQFNEDPLKIMLDLKKANSKIGVEIEKAEVKKILEKLEFKIEEKGENSFEVTVPTFRASKDVSIEDDLIEEIARMYGYDNIAPELPTLPTKLPLDNNERFKKHRARELFSYALGFEEVYNYSFYGQTEIDNCLMSEAGHLKVLNYLSEDQTHMRTSMVPNMLKSVQFNTKYFDNFKLYEIGRTYKEIGQFMPLEEKKICGIIVAKGKSTTPFYEAKGAVEAFLEKFNLQRVKVVKGVEKTPYAHPHRAITFLDKNGQTLAKAFMPHPTVVKNHDLEKYSLAIFMVNFTEALKLEQPIRSYKKLPKFPSIDIDIAILVDQKTEVGALEEAIRKAEPQLITSVNLFDIYEGPNIEADKKSVAFNVTLQAEDRTLTDEERTQIQDIIFKNLESIGGQIRGKN